MRSSAPRRGSDPAWMRPFTDRLSSVVRALIVIEILTFVFYAVVRQSQVFFNEHLALGPGVLAGEVWQLATSMFVHINFLGFIFDLLGIWFVAAIVERALGTRKFLTLFFATGIAANVVIVAVGSQLGTLAIQAGCGASVLALVVALGVIYDRTPLRFLGGLVFEARVLAAILVGFAFLMMLAQGAWELLAGDMVAAALGYLMVGGRGEGVRHFFAGLRAKRARRRYQILDGGRGQDRPPRTPYVN